MIDYRKGNLIEAFEKGEVGVIAHQANCFNTMGAGIAKALKDAYPEVYIADCKTTKGDKKKLGGYSVASTLDGLVFNLYGQYHYGRGELHTDYAALRESLLNMAHMLRHSGFCGKIGIPKLGCGLAGGQWEEVELIVEQSLWDFHVIVYEL